MTSITKRTEEKIAIQDQLAGLAVELAPHSGLFETARDLYLRGLNVFPIPRRHEVEAAAASGATHNGRLYNPDKDKPPYLLRPFFTARLHFCTKECKRREQLTGRPCHKPNEYPEKLFANANLALLLGRISQNLLALDCDTREAAAAVKDYLDARGIGYWSYSTYRGAVFLLRLAEGEAANSNRNPIPGLEIWGRLHYVVLPPSYHPQGVIYQWLTPEPLHYLPARELPPAVAAEDLAGLGVTLYRSRGGQAPDLLGLPGWAVHLSAPNRAILANGSSEGRRNTELTKAAYDLAALVLAGTVAEPEALDLLEAAADKCSPAYDLASLGQMWGSALAANPTPAKAFHGPPDRAKRSDYTKLAAWANSYRWPGRSGQTDRAAFLACIERARLDGGEPFRASVREIGELGNMRRDTAAKALTRLSGRADPAKTKTPRLLDLEDQDRQSRANRYKFRPPEPESPAGGERAKAGHYSPLVCSVTRTHALKPIPETPAEKDLFGRLGAVAWRTWQHLLAQPAGTFAEIARAIGCNPSSVSRAVRNNLIPAGMVGASEGHFYSEPKTEDDLERLAAGRGALGRSAKRKRLHERERQKRINANLARTRAYWHRRYLAWQNKS